MDPFLTAFLLLVHVQSFIIENQCNASRFVKFQDATPVPSPRRDPRAFARRDPRAFDPRAFPGMSEK